MQELLRDEKKLMKSFNNMSTSKDTVAEKAAKKAAKAAAAAAANAAIERNRMRKKAAILIQKVWRKKSQKMDMSGGKSRKSRKH